MKKQDLLNEIANFFLGEQKDIDKAIDIVDRIGFTRIEILSNDKILVIVKGPGMLLGKRGQTLEALKVHLKMDVMIVEESELTVGEQIIQILEFDRIAAEQAAWNEYSKSLSNFSS